MWPGDYIDWARRGKPLVTELVRRLYSQWYGGAPLGTEAAQLIEQAVRHAFNLATEHQRYLGYFPDEAAFRHWANAIAIREAIRLLLLHEELRLALLSAEDRCLLGMAYLDRLPYGDIAASLRLTADEARRRTLAALDGFLQQVKRSGAGGA